MLCDMTRTGRLNWANTLAIVNVLPEPVTPINVWIFLPACRASVSRLIACGWSPEGLNLLFSLNFAICYYFNRSVHIFHVKIGI